MKKHLVRSSIQLSPGTVHCTQKIRVSVVYGSPTLHADNGLHVEAKNGAALPDHIYLDAMGFGMGCCCLQLTFQACNVADARRMYDGLIPIGPILVCSHIHFSLPAPR